MTRTLVALLLCALVAGAAVADEAPIAGTITGVDAQAGTLTVQSAAGGKTRVVTIDVRAASKIVRFKRATEPGKTGFVEYDGALADLKPGWTVSVKTRHEGDREVAEIVRVVVER